MSFLDDLLNRRKVQDNTARIEQEMKPLIQKANARNVAKYKSGQINNDQYQKQMSNYLGTNNNRSKADLEVQAYRDSIRKQFNGPYAPGLVDYAVNNLSNGRESLIRDASKRTGLLDIAKDFVNPNTSKDKLNRLDAGANAQYINKPIQQDIADSARGAASSVGNMLYQLPGRAIQVYGGYSQMMQRNGNKDWNALTPFDVSEDSKAYQVGNSFFKSVEDYGKRHADKTQEIIQESRVGQRPDDGFAYNVGSGAGSLAASTGLALATGNPAVGSALFAASAGGDTYNDARNNGASIEKSLTSAGLNTGIQGATEYLGVDKFLKGADGGIVKNLLSRMASEGSQEFTQSLSDSAIGDIYKDVDYEKAIANAGVEGIYGSILGGAGSLPMDLVNNISNKPQVQAPLTPELQSKRNSLEIAQSQAIAQGRPQTAQAIAQQIQEIDNPSPGSLREQIRNAKNTIVTAYQQKTAMPNEVNLTDNALQTLTDFGDYKGGQYKADARTINELAKNAYAIAEQAGVDVTSGSPMDIQSRITDFVEDYKFRANAPRQGGFIGNDSESLSIDPPQNQLPKQEKGISVEPVPQTKLKGVSSSDTNPLESLKQPQKMTEEQYLSRNGAGFMNGSEPALHRQPNKAVNAQKNDVKRTMQSMDENNARRATLRQEYQQKVASGEITAPTRNELLIEKANGLPELESTQAAQRLLTKQGIEWKTSPVESLKQDLAREKDFLNNFPKLSSGTRRFSENKIANLEKQIQATQSQPPKSPLTVEKKPTLQDALEGKSTYTPISQPIDNIPAVARRVTKKVSQVEQESQPASKR